MSKDRTDMDRLADQVAEERSLQLAATRLGMSIYRAEYLWAIILHDLGRQAA